MYGLGVLSVAVGYRLQKMGLAKLGIYREPPVSDGTSRTK